MENRELCLEGKSDFCVIKKAAKDTKVVHCRNGNGSYSKKYFYRHRRQCHPAEAAEADSQKAVHASLLNLNRHPQFIDILGDFQQTPIGNLCRQDVTLQAIGMHLWLKDKAKVDKRDEVRKSVMTAMRTLAGLFLYFKEQENCSTTEVKDMFKRENWAKLVEAVRSMTNREEEGNLKYGLKNSLYYHLLKAAEIQQGEALMVKGDAGKNKVEDMEHFMKLLRHNQNAVFGDAKYCINKARQERLRLPERTPCDETMQKLRSFTLARIEDINKLPAEDFGRTEFVELRNLVCSRLTLFNARRGGEPCRMVVKQWTDRKRWLSDASIQRLPPTEKQLFSDMELMYSTGKGNHLVSCMVPRDCVSAM